MEHWHQCREPNAPDNPVNHPNFYFREECQPAERSHPRAHARCAADSRGTDHHGSGGTPNAHRHRAHLPQVPRLLRETLRDNLLMGLNTDGEPLQRALYQAVLDRDMPSLHHGLETMVGPREARLSGGQLQRAAAARMFVRQPEVLVFDDLSSALDVETEHVVWERLALPLNYTTVIAVSHRRAALQRADWILVLKALSSPGGIECRRRLLGLSMEILSVGIPLKSGGRSCACAAPQRSTSCPISGTALSLLVISARPSPLGRWSSIYARTPGFPPLWYRIVVLSAQVWTKWPRPPKTLSLFTPGRLAAATGVRSSASIVGLSTPRPATALFDGE
jgi:ABC transporter